MLFSRSLITFFLCSMQRTSSFMAQHHLWTYCVGRLRNKEVFSHSDLRSSRLSTNILNSIFTIVVIFMWFARARQLVEIALQLAALTIFSWNFYCSSSWLIIWNMFGSKSYRNQKSALSFFVFGCGWNQKRRTRTKRSQGEKKLKLWAPV